LKHLPRYLVALVFATIIGPLHAGGFGTQAEAKAMAVKAAQLVKEIGMEAAREPIHNRNGPFIDRDMYVFAYDNAGTALLHGMKPHLVGKNLLYFRDMGGELLVHKMLGVEPGSTRWIEYLWPDIATGGAFKKISYVIRENGYFIGVGVRKNPLKYVSAEN